MNFKSGDILTLKGIKVGDFNGKSLNVSDENLVTSTYRGWEWEILEKWANENSSKLSSLKCLTELKETFKPGQN